MKAVKVLGTIAMSFLLMLGLITFCHAQGAATPPATVAKPPATVAKPAAAVAKPAGTVAKPAAAVAKPAGTVAKPAAAVATPTAAVAKPAAAVAKPAAAVATPTAAVAKPAAAPAKTSTVGTGATLYGLGKQGTIVESTGAKPAASQSSASSTASSSTAKPAAGTGKDALKTATPATPPKALTSVEKGKFNQQLWDVQQKRDALAKKEYISDANKSNANKNKQTMIVGPDQVKDLQAKQDALLKTYDKDIQKIKDDSGLLFATEPGKYAKTFPLSVAPETKTGTSTTTGTTTKTGTTAKTGTTTTGLTQNQKDDADADAEMKRREGVYPGIQQALKDKGIKKTSGDPTQAIKEATPK